VAKEGVMTLVDLVCLVWVLLLFWFFSAGD
jgi:hypothetical protein